MTVWIIGHVWMTNGSSTHGYSFTVTQFDLAQALGPSEKMQPRAIPLPPLEVRVCSYVRLPLDKILTCGSRQTRLAYVANGQSG